MNNKNKKRTFSLLNIVILILMGSIVVFPLYMVLINSFKSIDQIFNSVLSLPTSISFENYRTAFAQTNLLQSVFNSLMLTVIGVVGIVTFGAMAGYKLARTPGKLSKIILLVFMSSMFIPFHSIMITLTRFANTIGIQGSIPGLSLIYIGLGVSMAIFLTIGFVSTIPVELEEAAEMDGATEGQIFRKIIIPLLSPILTTISILNMLWIWNDFLLPLLMLTDINDYTLVLSVNTLFGEYNNDWPSILAALVITTIPLIIVYIIMQKNIIAGISEGAVKG